MGGAIAVVAALLVGFFLMRGVQAPPPRAESEQELISQGYTLKEAKREARAQRAEQRAYSKTASSALRAGGSLGRLVDKIGK